MNQLRMNENRKRNNESAEDFMRLLETPIQEPSICIPRVTPEITEEQIRDVISGLHLGIIDTVELVKNKHEKENVYRAFIHFKEWDWSEDSTYVRKLLLRGEDVFVRYEQFKNWKMKMSRSSKWDHVASERPYIQNKARTHRTPLNCAKNKVNQMGMEPLEEGEEVYVR